MSALLTDAFSTGRAVTSILTTLLYPLVPWLMQLTVIVFYATLTLYVASMGTSEYRVTVLPDGCPESCNRFQVGLDGWWGHLVG